MVYCTQLKNKLEKNLKLSLIIVSNREKDFDNQAENEFCCGNSSLPSTFPIHISISCFVPFMYITTNLWYKHKSKHCRYCQPNSKTVDNSMDVNVIIQSKRWNERHCHNYARSVYKGSDVLGIIQSFNFHFACLKSED